MHQGISKNPGPTGFHGLLYQSIDSTSIIVQQSTTDLMDIFINANRNISSTLTNQKPDLMDLFAEAYTNTQRFHSIHNFTSNSSNMNTNFTEYNNSITVGITPRTDAKYAPSINNYSSRSLVPIKSTATTKPNQTNTTKKHIICSI